MLTQTVAGRRQINIYSCKFPAENKLKNLALSHLYVKMHPQILKNCKL